MFYRDFRDAARVFGRLQPAEDWERFLNNHTSTSLHSNGVTSVVTHWSNLFLIFCVGQRELQFQIKELIRYRKNGVTKLSGEETNKSILNIHGVI